MDVIQKYERYMCVCVVHTPYLKILPIFGFRFGFLDVLSPPVKSVKRLAQASMELANEVKLLYYHFNIP